MNALKKSLSKLLFINEKDISDIGISNNNIYVQYNEENYSKRFAMPLKSFDIILYSICGNSFLEEDIDKKVKETKLCLYELVIKGE